MLVQKLYSFTLFYFYSFILSPFLFLYEIASYYKAQSSLTLTTFLLLAPECWGLRLHHHPLLIQEFSIHILISPIPPEAHLISTQTYSS